ncbi:MAG: SRPBCC domain-containing protein [bacterium]|nr:SRPBCC domain-containing protein [bacterium]
MDKTKVTKDLENKTLIIERSFDAPKEKVWQAYANQAMFEMWWGPEGWEATTKVFDFRPGGTIHYGMKCVDKNQVEWFGKESWGMMKIESVEDASSFTAKDYFCNAEGELDSQMPAQRFTIEVIEEAGKTKLITQSVVETVEQLEELIKMGMVEGFNSQLNKLEVLLRT